MSTDDSEGGDDSIQEVVHELRRNRQRAELRRVENVQVLIAIGVIGTYFTSPVQAYISADQNLGTVTTYLSLIAGVFLVAKVFVLTTNYQWNRPRLQFIDELVIPLLFSFSTLGYFFSIIVFVFGLPTGIVAISVIVLTDAALSIKLILGKSSRDEMYSSDSPIIEYVRQNPDIVEQNVTYRDENRPMNGVTVDLVGTDDNGFDVAVKIEPIIDNERATELIENLGQNNYRIFVVSERFEDEARRRLEANGITCRDLNLWERINDGFLWRYALP